MLFFTRSFRTRSKQGIARQDSRDFFRKLSVVVGIICAAIEIALVIAMATNAYTDTVTPGDLLWAVLGLMICVWCIWGYVFISYS